MEGDKQNGARLESLFLVAPSRMQAGAAFDIAAARF
jgi:hypothetical protein